TNSAGVPFDPPLERRRAIQVIRITTRSEEDRSGHNSLYLDCINSDGWTVDKPDYGFHREFSPWQAYYYSYESHFLIENKKLFWQETKEFHIHPDQRYGWARGGVGQGHMSR